MSFLSRVLSRLRRGDGEPTRQGDPGLPSHDQSSTTGSGESGNFVGRVAGEDAGYLETGAERRAEEDASEQSKPD